LASRPGNLYVVATPIGNLDDMTARANDVLAKVDLVAAEDTRRAGQLLTRMGVKKRLISLHEHNEESRVDQILDTLMSGLDVALISDAGTPLISDPGFRLLAAARQKNLPVCPIPGSCAAIAALSIAGLPTDRFRFEGFLPTRAGPRTKRLEYLGKVPETLILYESVHRIVQTLTDLEQVLGPDREMTLARELTKLHETIYRGSISAVREQLNADPGGAKGEFTLVVAGCQAPVSGDEAELRRVLEVLLEELSPSQAASLAAAITGTRRNEAYRLANLLKQRC